MAIVYISGPYRDSRGAYWIGENIRKAREVAIKYWNKGYAVICPHMNTAFFDGAVPDESILEGDLELVSHSDLLIMLPGWRDSLGATKEYIHARSLGKGIILYEDVSDDGAVWS